MSQIMAMNARSFSRRGEGRETGWHFGGQEGRGVEKMPVWTITVQPDLWFEKLAQGQSKGRGCLRKDFAVSAIAYIDATDTFGNYSGRNTCFARKSYCVTCWTFNRLDVLLGTACSLIDALKSQRKVRRKVQAVFFIYSQFSNGRDS